MTIDVSGLGPVLDLGTALGIVGENGEMNGAWFSDPGAHVGRMLREPHQRDALLRVADALLAPEVLATEDSSGRRWIEIVSADGVAAHVVVTVTGPDESATTEVGIGARIHTDAPLADATAYVPLLRVPRTGAVIPAFEDPNVRIALDAGIVFDDPAAGAGDLGGAALAGLRLGASVGTDGDSPLLAVTLLGLVLPGQDTPEDLSLDVDPTDLEALGDQAIRLVSGLVQRSLGGVAGELADLLALVGFTDDPAIPTLPLDALLSEGVPAWRAWLQSVLDSPAAVDAWLAHLAALVAVAAANAPVVVPAGGPDLPHRVQWELGNGAELSAVLRTGRTADGSSYVDLGAEFSLATSGVIDGALEASATLVRITLGGAPTLTGLPSLVVAGRLGPAVVAVPADRLVNLADPSARVGSFRAGLQLDTDRHFGALLAAHDVEIGTHQYPVLDLTNAQTLADVAGDVVGDIAEEVLGLLGDAGTALRVLLGISAPDDAPSWPVELTPLTDLLANPLGAVRAYHERVLAEHRAGYAAILDPVRALLAPAGLDVPVAGDGEPATPWRLVLADSDEVSGLAVEVWLEGERLELAVAFNRAVADLGEGCPTVALRLLARLGSVALDGSGGQILPGAAVAVVFGARGGVPLRLGDATAAIVADSAGVELAWSPASGLGGGLLVPGLSAVIDGEEVAITLPEIGPDGLPTAPIGDFVPWRAVELLAGHLLARVEAPWADELVQLLGWLPGEASGFGLRLGDLMAAPPDALRTWLVTVLRGGRLADQVRRLAVLLTGPSADGAQDGGYRGRGDPAAPLALTLPTGDALPGLRVEALFWSDRLAVDPAVLQPGSLLSWLSDAAPGPAPSAAELAAALQAAATADATVSALLADRPDVDAGLAALVSRLADSDGLVSAGAALLPGATGHDLAGVAHLELPGAADLGEITGVPIDAGTIAVSGLLGVTAWPGITDVDVSAAETERVIDLRAPGLPASAFDLTEPIERDGPWLVLLPSRADAATGPGDDGAARLVERLARVVDAVAERRAARVIPPEDTADPAEPAATVTVVAHGAAGHAALGVADRPGVSHVVTLGTAHGGTGLDVLEAQPVAGAFALVAALLPAPDPDRPDDPVTARARALLAALTAAYAMPASPLADLVPPGPPAPLPGDVELHCVRGVVDATSVTAAVSAVLASGLAAASGTSDDAGNGVAGEPLLGIGVNLAYDPPATPGELRITVDAALTTPVLGAPVMPALRARVGIGRVGGWLAGGPDPARPADVARTPSLRRAELQLDLQGFGGDALAAASARVLLHEASALTVTRTLWEVSHSGPGDPLLPEVQVLLGRLAAALGPIPAVGSPRVLADLLAALGLLDGTAAGPIPTDATVGFSIDGMRRLLVDPAGLVRDATAAGSASAQALATALAALAGAPPSGRPGVVVARVGGVTVDLDVATGALTVAASGLAGDAGIELGGSFAMAPGGAPAASLTLAVGAGDSPNGRPVIELAVDASAGEPLSLACRWEGAGSTFPARVPLLPVPDLDGLTRILIAALPAQVLMAGIEFLRSLQPGAVALVDPALRLLGLIRGEGADARPVLPAALLADPGHWFGHATVLGTASGAGFDTGKLAALLDLGATVLGIEQPEPGVWTLPYGMELAANSSGGAGGGRATLDLGLAEPVAGAGLRIAGAVGVVLPGLVEGGDIAPAGLTAQISIALPGTAAIDTGGRLTLTLGSAGLAIRLVVPGSGVDISLWPEGPGLADLGSVAGAAATYALPLALDAIAGVPSNHPARPVGVALAALGDALALRVGGEFSGAELQLLGADPAGELARRLSGALPAGLDALSALLAPALPAGYQLARTGTELVFSRTSGGVTAELRLTVPGGGVATGLQVTAAVSGLEPLPGAALGGRLAASPSGLTEAAVTFAVDPASGLPIGPIVLAPVAEVAIGSAPAGGARVAAGLGLEGGDSVQGVLRFGPPVMFALEATGAPLAEALAALLVPVAVDLALATDEVTELLDREVIGTASLRELLDRVAFVDTGAGLAFDPGILDLSELWTRLLRLAGNIAAHTPELPVEPLTLGIAARDLGPGDRVYGVAVSLPDGQRFSLTGETAGTTVDVEVDTSWITSTGTDGLSIELLRITDDEPEPFFGISVHGIGVRVGSSTGPLLDTFVGVDSVALHTLASVGTTGVTDVGGQLELTGLQVALGGADDSTNQVAAGVMRDAASGGEPPAPTFSPGLAVQRHGGGDVSIDLRAGEGDGPWWIGIQHAFGPVYIEQIGLGVSRSGDTVIGVRVLVDGKVSLLGLVIAVDDLALGVTWPQSPTDPPLYDPAAWRVDLAGLAVSADTGGVLISGGLRRSPGALPDYVGMINIRFSVYAIAAYGGYAVVTDEQGEYTSLFIFGAVNAPIGGVPAFFVTGIGAGVGVNRLLLLPDDLAEFPGYPLIQALDVGSPMADPDAALDALREYFPADRGAFWFAAGISFNSFSLVQGVAVLAVAIGDGLDINLIGLARAALPNPAAPLVQVELALVVRFSSSEGVLWVQAQLTDNSFLLTRDCRLTGGFAYVMWFTGVHAGEFVLTLGGYHPSFHRDGYPVVPRLGFVWTVSSFLVIKGESYFALTSEAIMAGARFEASLSLGLLWAYLRLGADAIVYFDPFHFEVTAFAELGAGITIDIDLGWFGHIRITIAIHLHADVLLEGPEFRGRATIDLEVTSASIAFGDWSDRSTPVLDWASFDAKYLRPGGAAMLTATPGRGLLPPSIADSKSAPTGGAGDPHLLLPEFTLSVVTTAASSAVTANGPVALPHAVFLAIGPMHVGAVTSTLAVSVAASDGSEYAHTLAPAATTGQFPTGVWAPAAAH